MLHVEEQGQFSKDWPKNCLGVYSITPSTKSFIMGSGQFLQMWSQLLWLCNKCKKTMVSPVWKVACGPDFIGEDDDSAVRCVVTKIWTTHTCNKPNGQHHLPGLWVGCGSWSLVAGEEEKSADCVTVVRDTSIISNTQLLTTHTCKFSTLKF